MHSAKDVDMRELDLTAPKDIPTEFLAIAATQEILCIGCSKLHQMISSGEIVSVKIGRSRRVPLNEIIRYQKKVYDLAVKELLESPRLASNAS